MKFSKYNLLIPSEKKSHYYLFNTFCGSCFEVDKSIADIVKRTSMDSLQDETKDLFALSGVIIPDDMNEDHVLTYKQGRRKYSNTHFSSTVLLTWDCNLACSYCFQGLEKPKESMNMEQADRYINFVISTVNQNGVKSVSIFLFGGEPLINLDVGLYILEKVKSYCDENKIDFSSHIITNGTLLNDELIEKLYTLNCRTVQITIDGVQEVHDARRMFSNGEGSFIHILSSLHLLNQANNIFTVIRINIDKTNIKDALNLLDFIGKDGEALTNCTVDFGIVRTQGTACASYSSKCLSDAEIGDVLYDLWNHAEKQGFVHRVKPQRRYFYCGMYYDNAYSIAPNLDVYKCIEHIGVTEHLMGRIDEKGNFVNQTPAFYEWMSVNPLKNDECENCVYLPTCGGGCGLIAFNETGSYHAKGCFKVKGTVEKQVIKFVQDTMKSKCLSI